MRPTIKTTIGTHAVEYYEYITPRELLAVNEYLKKNTGDDTGANTLLLKTVLVSFDGSADGVVDRVLDEMRIDEYLELQEKIASLIDTKKK
jgi:hypothetical protein